MKWLISGERSAPEEVVAEEAREAVEFARALSIGAGAVGEVGEGSLGMGGPFRL